VDGAWADDDEQPALGVLALNDGDGLIAAGEDGFARLGRLRDLALQEIGGCEWVVAADAPVLRILRVADGWVGDVELNKVSEVLVAGSRTMLLTDMTATIGNAM
jgi:hypothetical protein